MLISNTFRVEKHAVSEMTYFCAFCEKANVPKFASSFVTLRNSKLHARNLKISGDIHLFSIPPIYIDFSFPCSL